jgi:hypothetical protein
MGVGFTVVCCLRTRPEALEGLWTADCLYQLALSGSRASPSALEALPRAAVRGAANCGLSIFHGIQSEA